MTSILPSTNMKYTIKQLQKEFPNDQACLDYVFAQKYDTTGYYPIRGRKSYVNKEGHQIHPLSGTIFEKSSTPLTLWFHALFLFASSKNGVSAKELQRQLGVTYKCAYRIGTQIRSLMAEEGEMLTGTVEIDETFYGRRGNLKTLNSTKSVLLGMVERQGRIKVMKVKHRGTEVLVPSITENIAKGTRIITDGHDGYMKVPKYGYTREWVNHRRKEWVRGDVYTNTIEGFWGQLKRSLHGTYHFVSPQHLQSYVNQFAYLYNQRNSSVPVFVSLVLRACV